MPSASQPTESNCPPFFLTQQKGCFAAFFLLLQHLYSLMHPFPYGHPLFDGPHRFHGFQDHLFAKT